MKTTTMDGLVRFALKAARRGFPRKPRVVGVRHRIGHDATGEPAVWVWILLADDTPDSLPHSGLAPIADQVRAALRETLERRTPLQLELVPYVRFRLKSEQDEIDRVGAA